MQNFIIAILLILCTASPAMSAHQHPEKWYQNKWCAEHNGKAEVVLPDRTRCDCLSNTHAIEFDYGEKWTEAIGQSLYYAIQTGKRAGVVLILEERTDYKYWIRLNTIIDHFKLPVDVWSIDNYR